jgi:hypothetical protein
MLFCSKVTATAVEQSGILKSGVYRRYSMQFSAYYTESFIDAHVPVNQLGERSTS